MKKLILIFWLSMLSSTSLNAQLANGSIAPDFWLTDLNGNSHNLYTYLDQGKVVFIEFFACHCPSCWAYHNTNKLKDLYVAYGPSGTDQLMVLMLEHDEFNGYNEFHGITQGWPTQGDWVTGNPIPMINVEGNDRWVFSAYNMTYYPMVMKVCPDKTVELMSTSLSTSELFAAADDCPGTLNLNSTEMEFSYSFISSAGLIEYLGNEPIDKIEAYNMQGQSINLVELSKRKVRIKEQEGVYIIRFTLENGLEFVERIYLE